jgi:Co/Zn/Cd efflux system component
MKATASREVRLCVMLALSFTFFLVELIVGYMVKSIALVADSFHMLSDVLALVVALYAIKVRVNLFHIHICLYIPDYISDYDVYPWL